MKLFRAISADKLSLCYKLRIKDPLKKIIQAIGHNFDRKTSISIENTYNKYIIFL